VTAAPGCTAPVIPTAPVYLRDGGEPRLHVRVGNATAPLAVDEAVRYVGSRWVARTTGDLLGVVLGRRR
jgi:hypothetical protein